MAREIGGPHPPSSNSPSQTPQEITAGPSPTTPKQVENASKLHKGVLCAIYYQKRIQSDFHTKTQNKKEQSLEGV